jgi:hypothetical protein
MSAISKPTIYDKMSAISHEVERLNKDFLVRLGKGGSYKAVSELSVLEAIKPLEEKYRVFSYPAKRTIVRQETVVDEISGGLRRNNFLCRIETTYRFVDMDNPSNYIEVTSYGDGLDTGDKGVGKAMTYSDKYALMKAYKIVTGEDPDKEASPELTRPASRYKTPDNPLTQKQAAYIASLLEQKGLDSSYVGQRFGKAINDLTYAEASQTISDLRNMPDRGDEEVTADDLPF